MGVWDPTRECYAESMDTHLSVPTRLLKKHLHAITRKGLKNAMRGTNEGDTKRWLNALQDWREAWDIILPQSDAARELLKDPEVWDFASHTLPFWKSSSEWERTGDLDNNFTDADQDRFKEEQDHWKKRDWLATSVPRSTTEWMSLSVLDMEEKFGIQVDQPTWEARVEKAFQRDAGGLLQRLLNQHPEWSITPLFSKFTAPKSDYDYDKGKPPLAHLLFEQHYKVATQALNDERLQSLLSVPNHQGQTPLFGAVFNLEKAEAFLKRGVNPSTLDEQGRFPEEAACQRIYGGLEQAQAFHTMANRYRSAEQASAAHRQWLAAVCTGETLPNLKKHGLFSEIMDLGKVQMNGRSVGLFTYILNVCFPRHSSKEKVTLAGTLAKGPRGQALLKSEGSVAIGLGKAIALALSNSDSDYNDRSNAFRENIQSNLKAVLSDPAQRHELAHTIFENLPIVYGSTYPHLFGLYGVLKDADPTAIHWDISRLSACHAGFLNAARHTGMGMPQGREYQTAVEWADRWSELAEGDVEQQRVWLPSLLAMASLAADQPIKDRMCERAAAWMTNGIEPLWPDANLQAQLEKRFEVHLKMLFVRVRANQMEQTFQQVEPVKRSGPRL